MAVQHCVPAMQNKCEGPGLTAAERRRGERFPLTMNLRFRRLFKNESWTAGTSLNFSNTGILFVAERPTHLGASLELVVEWPSDSEAVAKRELVVVGMVVRIRDSNNVALAIRKFAFRIAESQDQCC